MTGPFAAMRKTRPKIAVLLLVFAGLRVEAYDNLDYGVPGWCDQVVDRVGYALGFVDDWKQPAWVSYRLTADEAKGTAVRTDDFRADPEIVSGSATLADYRDSTYDRGHLAPAGDMAWSRTAMSESFLLSNMSPQKPTLNRGLWSRIEAAVRNFALNEGSVIVVTGPVGSASPGTRIGASGVMVPEKFYKVVFSEKNYKMIGFVVSQDSTGTASDFVCSVNDVEQLTGLDFFSYLDDEVEDVLEARVDRTEWTWSGGASEESTDDEEYAVEPGEPLPLSAMEPSGRDRLWSLDLASLTNVYPKPASPNVADWVNGCTVSGLYAYVDGVANAELIRNFGKTTKSGYYAFWEAGAQVTADSYSFGTMTSANAGRQVFGVAFCNDVGAMVGSVDIEYVGRQFGFRNRDEQSLVFELLVANVPTALCNGRGWAQPSGLTFVTPEVGNSNLVSGESAPRTCRLSASGIPVSLRRGDWLLMRWRREAEANGACLGVDSVRVRFNAREGMRVMIW